MISRCMNTLSFATHHRMQSVTFYKNWNKNLASTPRKSCNRTYLSFYSVITMSYLQIWCNLLGLRSVGCNLPNSWSNLNTQSCWGPCPTFDVFCSSKMPVAGTLACLEPCWHSSWTDHSLWSALTCYISSFDLAVFHRCRDWRTIYTSGAGCELHFSPFR